jgi:hypothetical protein
MQIVPFLFLDTSNRVRRRGIRFLSLIFQLLAAGSAREIPNLSSSIEVRSKYVCIEMIADDF